MNKGVRLAALLGVALVSSAQVATFAQEVGPVVGAGSTRCSDLRNMAPKDQLIVVSWAQGFLSGANVKRAASENEFLELPNVDWIAGQLDANCAAKPTQSVYLATTQMYKKLEASAKRLPVPR